ncbi:hypothetical protein LINPERHAP2_LOCUS32325 [Linum perenne]
MGIQRLIGQGLDCRYLPRLQRGQSGSRLPC